MSGFPTRRAAQAALNEALAEYQHGTFVAPSKQTLSEFVETWLDAVKLELAESAWTNYRRLLSAYVLPRLGSVRLVGLTPQKIQAMYADLLGRGKRDGSALSPRSVLQVHKTLHRSLADAVRSHLLARNPADGARAPRSEAREMTAWSLEDAQRFLTATRGERLWAMWLVALNTGASHLRCCSCSRGRFD